MAIGSGNRTNRLPTPTQAPNGDPPPAAAGASGTVRVESVEALDHALGQMGIDHGVVLAVEEFVEGHEGFYDTLTIGGEIVHDFISHYFPNVLEAMRTRWISPQIVATNRIHEPGYDEVKAMGARGAVARVSAELGIDDHAAKRHSLGHDSWCRRRLVAAAGSIWTEVIRGGLDERDCRGREGIPGLGDCCG